MGKQNHPDMSAKFRQAYKLSQKVHWDGPAFGAAVRDKMLDGIHFARQPHKFDGPGWSEYFFNEDATFFKLKRMLGLREIDAA